MTADLVKELLNKEVTVEMKVVATGETKKGDLAFLNSHVDRASDENFTVVLNKERPSRAGEDGHQLATHAF